MKKKERWRTVKEVHEIDHRNITKALQKRLGLDFSSFFSYFSPILVEFAH